MKKTIVLLLVLLLSLSLVACGNSETGGDVSSQIESNDITSSDITSSDLTSDDVSSDDTSSFEENNQTEVSSNGSSSQSAPTKLNPKTDFKYGTYKASFFADNNKKYYQSKLFFYDAFETVEMSYVCYYSLEGATEKYAGWEMEFNPDDCEFTIEVDGVTYYDIDMWGSVPTGYELTDTAIIVEDVNVFSLNANGTLVLETNEDSSLGSIGTVYTFVNE